jgi:hypothetical protein
MYYNNIVYVFDRNVDPKKRVTIVNWWTTKISGLRSDLVKCLKFLKNSWMNPARSIQTRKKEVVLKKETAVRRKEDFIAIWKLISLNLASKSLNFRSVVLCGL